MRVPAHVDAFAAMQQALELFRHRRFDDVLAAASPGLAVEPGYVPLRVLMCRALLALRRDREAKEHLRYCLELDPECAAAHRYLGELHFRRDRLQSAASFLREACRLNPDDVDAQDLLEIVDRLNTPAAEAPPRAPAAERAPSPRPGPAAPPQLAQGTGRPASAPPQPSRRPRRLAAGTGGSRSRPGTRPSRRRDPFGDYLVELGMISRAQLRAARIYRRTRGGDLGRAALALGFVSQAALARAANAYGGRGG